MLLLCAVIAFVGWFLINFINYHRSKEIDKKYNKHIRLWNHVHPTEEDTKKLSKWAAILPDEDLKQKILNKFSDFISLSEKTEYFQTLNNLKDHELAKTLLILTINYLDKEDLSGLQQIVGEFSNFSLIKRQQTITAVLNNLKETYHE